MIDAGSISRAIVAACIETGDDPVLVARGGYVLRDTRRPVGATGRRSGQRGKCRCHPRARFYAFAALLEEFYPTGATVYQRARVASFVGVAKSFSFGTNAANHVKDLRPATVARVRAAIRGCADVDVAALWAARPPVSPEPAGAAGGFSLAKTRLPGPAPALPRDQIDSVPTAARVDAAPPPHAAPPARVVVVRTSAAPPRPVRVRARARGVGVGFDEIKTRRRASTSVEDVTAEFCGDPPPDRSALPPGGDDWVPYEQRVKNYRPWRSMSSSQPSRHGEDG